jgi:DNA-binding CsgD family transcriptional regulator
VVAALLDRTDGWLAPPGPSDSSDRLLAAEPLPYRLVPGGSELDEVLRVFGETADLKTPYLHGHCTQVSLLADGACRRLGLPDPDVALARRAGLVADVGRVAVPSSVWEHPGALGTDAWQQVRLHAYQSEQVLARSAPLRALARLAGSHHEHLDGSGYHRAAVAAQLPATTRVLAAADRYVALVADRPHRPRRSPAAAGAVLRAAVRAGHLDPNAVHAVMAGAEGSTRRRPRPPGGLTQRQVQVLRVLAAGLSNRAIGERLGISSRTAEHHVQDVYARIGVTSRAAAALFAMEHGLLGPQDVGGPTDERCPPQAHPRRGGPSPAR